MAQWIWIFREERASASRGAGLVSPQSVTLLACPCPGVNPRPVPRLQLQELYGDLEMANAPHAVGETEREQGDLSWFS